MRAPDHALAGLELRRIEATHIIGTDLTIYSAWELTNWGFADAPRHSTLQSFDGRFWGRIGTRELPAYIEAMRGEERYAMATRFQRAQYELARGLILSAHPELRGPSYVGEQMGEITAREARS